MEKRLIINLFGKNNILIVGSEAESSYDFLKEGINNMKNSEIIYKDKKYFIPYEAVESLILE